jgi:hypothetical protein
MANKSILQMDEKPTPGGLDRIYLANMDDPDNPTDAYTTPAALAASLGVVAPVALTSPPANLTVGETVLTFAAPVTKVRIANNLIGGDLGVDFDDTSTGKKSSSP